MKDNIGETSDGYHTFNELYEQRHTLYIALCKSHKSKAWRATKHSDGTSYDGWFILGLCKEQGKQITYHLPMSKWGDCAYDAGILDETTAQNNLEEASNLVFNISTKSN